jgi:adenylosuccinate lyase
MDAYENYQSPFTWRYGSAEMRSIWSEASRRRLWRKIWLALASVQSEYGLVTPAQVEELAAHVNDVDIPAALKIEAEIHHDLMAELKTYASQCPNAGGALHMGATSMDIEDNADALRLRQALDLTIASLGWVLLALAERMDSCADLPIMAFTHIQPAEPSTLGYRLGMTAQDLLADYRNLVRIRTEIRGKGFKGAVGTAASYMDLLGEDAWPRFEARLSEELDLPFFAISTQTYPRKQDYEVVSALAGLGATLHKFALDLRLLQSPPIGEISEPFGAKQVGSSAMPFKRNPINAEKVDSLTRELSVLPQVAWQNAASSILERTLDDSANRRTILPEAFLICDEVLAVIERLVKKFEIRTEAIEANLAKYAPFASTERVMMAAARRGADRQAMHETLRNHALAAWQEVQQGRPNDLIVRLQKDPEILRWVTAVEVEQLARVSGYTGIAPVRAREMAVEIRGELMG